MKMEIWLMNFTRRLWWPRTAERKLNWRGFRRILYLRESLSWITHESASTSLSSCVKYKHTDTVRSVTITLDFLPPSVFFWEDSVTTARVFCPSHGFDQKHESYFLICILVYRQQTYSVLSSVMYSKECMCNESVWVWSSAGIVQKSLVFVDVHQLQCVFFVVYYNSLTLFVGLQPTSALSSHLLYSKLWVDILE